MRSMNRTEQTKEAFTFRNVSFSYEKNGMPVLKNLNFTVERGSRTVLFGPSGSGKSTLLRLMSGLLKPDGGELAGDPGRISMVFQKDCLFDDLTVLENIMYGLPAGSVSKTERRDRACQWAEHFCCASLLNQKAGTLSGGQRQRAALARAFMKNPDTLLLDESFQGLDAVLREQLISEILSLQAERGFTMVLVTHSFSEAMKTSQNLILLQNGRIEQQAPVLKAANDPSSLFTAGSLGYFPMNILPVSAVPYPFSLDYEEAAWIGFYPWQAVFCQNLTETDWQDSESRLILETGLKSIQWANLGFAWTALFEYRSSRIEILTDEKTARLIREGTDKDGTVRIAAAPVHYYSRTGEKLSG